MEDHRPIRRPRPTAGRCKPLAGALSAVKAEKYAAHAVANPAEYGFDKPALRIKFTLTERKVNKPGDEPKEETKERALVIGKPEAEGKTAGSPSSKATPNSAVFVLAGRHVQGPRQAGPRSAQQEAARACRRRR